MFVPLFDRANMSCMATGFPQPTIQWYKDGSLLAGETSSVVLFEEVSLSDRGFYHCSAINDKGAVDSASAVLGVINIRQYVTPVFVSLLVPDMEDSTFTAQAALLDLATELNNQAAGLQLDLNSSVVFLYRIQLFGSPISVSSTRSRRR